MRTKAVLRLQFPSERLLEIVCKALTPEVEKPPTTRSIAKLERNGRLLVLKVEAKDAVALRAALNAYLRWINSTLNILGVLENFS